MDNLVSILVPCYNGEQFIERCFTSIINQDYSAMEVIVVNDGSDDGSEQCILAWSTRFKDAGMQLICLSQENKGTAGAINTGLKHVNGEFLVLLDVDDELLPSAISSRVEFLRTNTDMNAVRTNGYYIRKSGKSLFVYDDAEKNIDNVFAALIEGKTNNWAGSYMVRTSALFAFYPNREIYQSRYGQNLQILLPLTYNQKCGFIDEPQMNYIIQEDSLSHTSTTDSNEQMEISIEQWSGYLDIRTHLIQQIVAPPEMEKYAKLARAGYYRLVLSKAVCLKNEKVTQKAFADLKKENAVTIMDVINYCRVFYPYAVFPLRCLRKLGTFFGA